MTQFETGEERSPSIPHEVVAGVQGDLVVAKGIRKAPLSKFGTVRAIRRAFSNWYAPVVLLALDVCLHVRRPITWRSRSGAVLVTPAGDGSSNTVRDVFIRDEYGLNELSGAEIASVVDVGANVGAFSLRVAELFPDVRISAFEPSPPVYAQLRDNIRANQSLGRIDAQRFAVVGSPASQEVDFWMDVDGSPRSTTIGSLARERSEGRWTKVPATSLRSVLASAGPVDLLKLDVERAEYEILKETPPTALGHVSRIVVEYHPVEGRHFAELVESLVDAGFHLRRHECLAPGVGWLWFDRAPSPVFPDER